LLNRSIVNFIKAGVIACFFLLSPKSTLAIDKVWQFDAELLKAYQLVLNLQTDQAQAQLAKLEKHTNELHRIYVLSLCETVDVLISEDEKKIQPHRGEF